MADVQNLFLNAAALIPEVVATQAAVATRGLAATVPVAAAAEWLDDDLDVGGRAAAGPARGASSAPVRVGVSSTASLLSAAKLRCAGLLGLLGPLQPQNGAAAAEHWLDQAQQPGEVRLHVGS